MKGGTLFMSHNITNKANRNTLIRLLTGSFILAIGINLFLSPHSLAFGGVTGTTIILQSLTGLPLFVSNLALSTIVILIGWFDLGHEFMVKTIIPTMILPLFLFLTTPLSKLAPSLELSAIIGAVTVGIGISLTMHAGGSTAGPDTIGLVLKNRFGIPVTITMLVIDIFVISCGYRVYGLKTAAWSIGVAILMNLTVKFMRNILSKKVVFRYWYKRQSNEASVSKS